MIDIHSHILPGIDDGTKTIDDSIAMAKHVLEQGGTTIIYRILFISCTRVCGATII